MIEIDSVANALKHHELYLEYLPTVSLETEHCVGTEALVRWRRDDKIIPPEEFIPVVENTPLSGLITYWVIETAARELGAWLWANDNIHLSINVPPEILGRGGMEYAAIKAGIAELHSKIILEVTERGVPDKIGVDAINRAMARGIRVALDDVGTGGANLAVLCRAHVDMIKIDKSFVAQFFYDDKYSGRLAAFAAILRSANLDIVVEGVESEAQARILKEAGIRMAQGFYFSPPLAAADFENYYRTHC
ncbi:MAG TPA: EAL domain-containing protein [Burkholderiales bacterium]|nr:EAL domain-containing protein [Burkholderiales bacterium]